MRVALALVGSLSLSLGCAPDVGECNQLEAEAVAYEVETGLPAYEGQALMVASCGYGSFCHADVDADARLGVPRGLEMDVQLAASDGRVDPTEIERFRHARFRVVQEAETILRTVRLGTMPPSGDEAEAVRSGAPTYQAVDDTGAYVPLPGPETAAGREILRNWLACGAPMVERPVPRDDGLPAEVRPALPVEPIEPTDEGIFTGLLQGRGCDGSLCHGGPDAGFQVTTQDATIAQLLGAASAPECSGVGGSLVVPCAPEESLLYLKITREPPCGDPMPPRGGLREEDVQAVRAWIEGPLCE